MADSYDSLAPRSPFRVWRAFTWSLKGLRATWMLESSFRLEVYLFVLLAPLVAGLSGLDPKSAVRWRKAVLLAPLPYPDADRLVFRLDQKA